MGLAYRLLDGAVFAMVLFGLAELLSRFSGFDGWLSVLIVAVCTTAFWWAARDASQHGR